MAGAPLHDWIEVAAALSKAIRARKEAGTLAEPVFHQDCDEDGNPIGEPYQVSTVGEQLGQDYADAVCVIGELLSA